MLRLRPAACVDVSTAATFRETEFARAGASVILSATCAMRVPSPTMNAARISMLRITPTRSEEPQYHHASRKTATNGGGEGGHFGEKDDRRVNGGSLSLVPGRVAPHAP